MRIDPYTDDLRLAFCYRVYFCFQTSSRRKIDRLQQLDQRTLQDLAGKYDIRILDTETTDMQIRCQVSLQPQNTVSVVAGQLKGRISSWLNANSGEKPRVLARGYFACTTGDTSSAILDRYMENQGIHHHYSDQPLPPVFVRTFPEHESSVVSTAHAATRLRYHIVLSTVGRRGVFTTSEAKAITQSWDALSQEAKFHLEKVSFVPDHVHIAVRAHPDLSPLSIVLNLMDWAQNTMDESFGPVMTRFVGDELWVRGGYIGSFGDYTTDRTRNTIAKWAADRT